MAKCSKCNNEIEDNSMFCEHCGAEVNGKAYVSRDKYNFSKAKAVAIAVATIAVIGIVLLAILKITGGSGVSASGYVENWNNNVKVVKEDLKDVYKYTIIEEMLKKLDMDDADKNGNTYEFELCEVDGQEAVLILETGALGTVNEVSVLMEVGVLHEIPNDFFSEEDLIESLKIIPSLALGSMFDNKAAYRDAVKIVDDAFDDCFESTDECFNETYDDIEITMEVESEEYWLFTAKRV